MTRIVRVAVAATLLLSCSDDDAGRRAAEPDTRPIEIARVDTGLVSIEDAAGARVPPEEESRARTRNAPHPPVPAQASRPRTPEPRPLPNTSTSSPSPSAPDAPRGDSLPTSSSAMEPATDSAVAAPAPEPRTAPEPAPVPEPVPPPARAPDTVGTSRPMPPRAPVRVPSTEAGTSRGTTVTIPVGTELHASLVDSIHSRHDSAGQAVTAKVMENVAGPDGRTVIPAGSVVRLTVVRLEPAGSRSAADGELALRVDGIARGDETLEVAAEVRPVPHELRGRGVTGSEAAKVGAGAAAGAIAGRVLGGDTRGAVIGGVVGAAGGAAVAAQTADRDVVVKAGTPISFVLTAPLTVGRL